MGNNNTPSGPASTAAVQKRIHRHFVVPFLLTRQIPTGAGSSFDPQTNISTIIYDTFSLSKKLLRTQKDLEHPLEADHIA
jgi:hypothetical protein